MILLIVLLFVVPFSSCKKKVPEMKKPSVEKGNPTDVSKVEGAEEEKVLEAYKYDPKGRRDPFLSLIEVTKKKPEKKKGASPFESYDIAEIQLLAIAWDEKDKYYALIRLPNNKTYTITEGVTLGLQNGKVEKIYKDSVLIREYVKDYKGDLKPVDTILRLHKGE
jgi:type IV pilus assembly protein PilP